MLLFFVFHNLTAICNYVCHVCMCSVCVCVHVFMCDTCACVPCVNVCMCSCVTRVHVFRVYMCSCVTSVHVFMCSVCVCILLRIIVVYLMHNVCSHKIACVTYNLYHFSILYNIVVIMCVVYFHQYSYFCAEITTF